MVSFIVKRLASSEIKWFKSVERRLGIEGGSQKGISPTSSLFRKRFPALSEDWEGRIDVVVHGPGLVSGHVFHNRKLNRSNKNWRIQSDVNDIPLGSPYLNLSEGDFAVIEFSGQSIPESANIFLISLNNKYDADIHAHLDEIRSDLADGSTQYSAFLIESSEMYKRLPVVQLPASHSLLVRLLEAEAEAAIETAPSQFTASTLGTLNRLQHAFRRLRLDEFTDRKKRNEEIGAFGEGMVATFLAGCEEAGQISMFTWISRETPGAPYDFIIELPNGEVRRVEVKSTTGGLGGSFHLSDAELRIAIFDKIPYDIYYVSGVGGAQAQLSIARNAGENLRHLAEQVRFPKDLSPDGYIVSYTCLPFDDPIGI